MTRAPSNPPPAAARRSAEPDPAAEPAPDPALTRLDPALPICWEDPDTLRVGFERPIARLSAPSAGMQRFVGALRRGIDANRLPEEARRVGATTAEARDAIAQLRPALRAGGPAPRASALGAVATVICGSGRATPALAQALAATGLCRLPNRDAFEDPGDPELVVYVERYWEPLERAQRWLMAGVPHLLVRFTDGAVHVGPIVPRDGGPCHTCVSLARVDRDAATAALAAQLAGAPVASETPELAVLAAAHAAGLIRAWLAGDAAAHRTRIELDAPSTPGWSPPRVARVSRVDTHPECACGSVDAEAG
ncbi:hypothetical protein [Leucobacter chromiiresistens]|uniref:Bacteriocin biosynthesis cyclodehydratase domain-containing protein n=1 Tax=Leucobacter chromiiresistens TaxID=1079994 RepID=A0A147ES81_9MICO|nr:hypothetical protein [Leucobacter chromiiresistens]KTR87384.1 hypothetical protein NS354_00475 [Leucobacter chromiiresistens]